MAPPNDGEGGSAAGVTPLSARRRGGSECRLDHGRGGGSSASSMEANRSGSGSRACSGRIPPADSGAPMPAAMAGTASQPESMSDSRGSPSDSSSEVLFPCVMHRKLPRPQEAESPHPPESGRGAQCGAVRLKHTAKVYRQRLQTTPRSLRPNRSTSSALERARRSARGRADLNRPTYTQSMGLDAVSPARRRWRSSVGNLRGLSDAPKQASSVEPSTSSS